MFSKVEKNTAEMLSLIYDRHSGNIRSPLALDIFLHFKYIKFALYGCMVLTSTSRTAVKNRKAPSRMLHVKVNAAVTITLSLIIDG